MSNRQSFKLQFEGRIRSNCRGLNNITILPFHPPTAKTLKQHYSVMTYQRPFPHLLP